jgi:hypothetical protein
MRFWARSPPARCRWRSVARRWQGLISARHPAAAPSRPAAAINPPGLPSAPPTAVTTLDVNNLTQAIAPASGTAGISFSSAGAVSINSNTGTFGITTSNANGIYANGSLAVTVTSTGNITTTGNYATGIYARSAV